MPTKQELGQQIIEKAWADAQFKQQLLADPKAAIKDAFNVDVPANINLQVLEETEDSYYLVLPQNPASVDDGSVKGPMWD
ncbi:NHLP leader peptide family RiPP precursor [Paenibacillus sp. J5C_2022]|uniref:NHLP leader peptide family RiPP precursor n=1 Tax=Paenibacillus sp. J5C2022 TaxID=2977129 RepID=UPI0021D2096D|nr:NHLP leader peptide family RiPP precursor [Paenibacillus sp. J5C2022]MCU6711788.1 NHLP leader peptide family RiPP precursor [Paenibacillus sp. J5C2022]